MGVIDNVLNAFQADTITSLVILLVGFLICHIIHAVRYGIFGGTAYGMFDKIKGFFKQLLFLER